MHATDLFQHGKNIGVSCVCVCVCVCLSVHAACIVMALCSCLMFLSAAAKASKCEIISCGGEGCDKCEDHVCVLRSAQKEGSVTI